MDPNEVQRLLRIIHGHGHEMGYDPRTRIELDEWGLSGRAEAAIGPVKLLPVPVTKDADSVCACTTIAPGEMLTRADNKTGPCAWGCGRTVQYRPWVTIPTVCLYCCAERPKEAN